MKSPQEPYHGALKNMPPISCPELYADDNDVYFSRFDGKNSSSPLEDCESLRELLDRLDKLDSLIQDLIHKNISRFNAIVGGLRQKLNEQQAKSWWDIAPETLSVNELLFLVCYPFFDRWGGSWEARFALSGGLGKYLSLYKRKLQAEADEATETVPQTQ